jgi:hypothetical protein
MTELPLPGMPEPPQVYQPPAKEVPGLRATRIKTLAALCEQCCRDIYDLGVSVAPYPQVARWKVTEGGVPVRLCEAHKNERFA